MSRPSVNGLGSFLTTSGKNVLVFMDSDGGLWAENPYPNQPVSGLFVVGAGELLRLENLNFILPANCFMDCTAAYGKLFMVWSDLQNPVKDSNNLTVGPRKFYWDDATQRFHYEGTGFGNNIDPPTAPASVGTGDIATGTRYAVVLYRTRPGFITGWESSAILKIEVTAEDKEIQLTLPALPGGIVQNIVERIVAFTQAGASSDGPYFYIPESKFLEGLNAPVDGDGNNITKTTVGPVVNADPVIVTFTFPDEFLIASVDVTQFTDKGAGASGFKSVFFSQSLRRLIYCGSDTSTWWVSEPDDPETIYGSTGFCQPGFGDNGTPMTTREFHGEVYFMKDTGGYLAVDTSLNPVDWRFQKRWEGHGPEGPWAVDVCEEFMAWAHRKGPYVFTGNDPMWIGYNISGNTNNFPSWDNINWTYAHKIYVLIDNENKVVKFGVPLGDSTKVNIEFIVDYSRGWKELRWSWDDVATTKAVRVKRPITLNPDSLGYDARIKQSQILHASNADDGLILFEDPTNHTLNGSPIVQEVQLAFTPYQNQPGIYQIGAVDVTMRGNGSASMALQGDREPQPILMDIPLSGQIDDFDRKTRGQNERWSAIITNKGELNNWFELYRVVYWINMIWQTRSV